MSKRAIVWFRSDLRTDDNESLLDAARDTGGEVVPVYVFDDRVYRGETHEFGFPKTGPHRIRFMRETVEDLRSRLRALGSDLVVRRGRTEEVLAGLADQTDAGWVYCNRERTSEEVRVQDALEKSLWDRGQELRYARGKMLFYTADLPFPVSHTPDVFTQFRKEVERIVQVREPLSPPGELKPLPDGLEVGEIPSFTDLKLEEEPPHDERAVLRFEGGESVALERLRYYLWKTDLAKTYKQTRNGLLGGDYSTKLSAWLAAGALSPKRVYHEVRRYESERGANDSTYWIFFELLWRDFFRLMTKKHGDAIFYRDGPKGEPVPEWSTNRRAFAAWAEGRTGVPFVDANMREINATGFMSNRGRQNVASFLVRDMKLDWRMGAEYFESLLVDYDVASNWCNWNYVAGVGSDPREDRYFNILSQAERYDPEGDYVRHWLPELAELPKDRIHRPDLLTDEEQRRYGVRLGVDYPNAVVDISKWAKGARKSRGASRQSRARRRGGRHQFIG